MRLRSVLAVVLLAGCVAGTEAGDGIDDSFATGKADGETITAAEEAAVLAVANTATLEELDVDAGLDARAARGIVAERPFATLAELDAVPYVGPVALELLLAYAGEGQCLVISEYLEGQGNYNKGVELWNCGAGAVALGDVGICLVRDSATACSYTTMLDGTVAPGGVLTLCRTRSGTFNDPMATLRDRCQVETSVMTFSGNDRMVVFRDLDGDARFGAADEVLDAFGWIARAPATELWADMVLRRCNAQPFDGAEFFPYLDYFTKHARHDHADYGVAPTSTSCL